MTGTPDHLFRQAEGADAACLAGPKPCRATPTQLIGRCLKSLAALAGLFRGHRRGSP
jgi:hypothetical protein